jgi:hypothetical protein
MADPAAPPPPDIRGAWALKLSGAGFNWYRNETALQADDLWVRTRAGALLTSAAGRLREIERLFRARHMPAPTREHPFPDPGRAAELRRIEDMRERVTALETKVRGSVMPTADRVSLRHRGNEATLARLLEADTDLIGASHDLEAGLKSVDEGDVLGEPAQSAFSRSLGYIEAALAKRAAILV